MTIEDVIGAAVARCDSVVDGVEELRPFLAPLMPLSPEALGALTPVQRIASVALLKRYEQLQDLLGRLFRAYLSWEAEDVRAMTRRDQANQLEKFGIIDDADDWVRATELRNRLVHEYPIDEDEQIARINDCWSAIWPLIENYAGLKAILLKRGILS